MRDAALRVGSSPFTQEQVDLLRQLLPGLSPAQRMWLSGFLQGIDASDAAAPPGEAAGAAPVTVLFASQTGNAEGLARDLAARLEASGHSVLLSTAGAFPRKRLRDVARLCIVASTQGEGDPPDDAAAFCAFLESARAPRLEHLSFAILALGDRTYEKFCETGRALDRRLEELGARRICPRVDCDLDYDEAASGWMEAVLQAISAERIPAVARSAGEPSGATSTGHARHGRQNPFPAQVLEQIPITGRGSQTDVRHLEISLAGSGMTFRAGDSLAVYPRNDARLVDALIARMHWHPETPIGRAGGEAVCLRQVLLEQVEITRLTPDLVRRAGSLSRRPIGGSPETLKAYVEGRDLLDLAHDLSLEGVPAAEVVGLLRRMPARLYSIANSSRAAPEEVHLAAKVVRYRGQEREREGVCSTYLSRRAAGETLSVYVNGNPRFRPPEDPDAPLIMVGPGTGVAPFRAFLEEREEMGAGGPSWLFFGARHFRTDFLYQTDWQRWLREGVLTRMDVAFSRDSAQRTYVQDRMRERGADLFDWLEAGAYLYVCGDALRMARGVDAALVDIIVENGRRTTEEARDFLERLRSEGRYLRDVY